MDRFAVAREELVGAWRSLRYDLRRHADASRTNTDVMYPEYDAYARRPHRIRKIGGMASLAVAGVAGTYLALASGLGGLLLGSADGSPPAGTAGSPTRAIHAPVAARSSPNPPRVSIGTPGPARSVPAHHSRGPSPTPSAVVSPAPSPTARPGPPTYGPTPSPTPSETHPSGPAPTGTPTSGPTPTGTPTPAPSPSNTTNVAKARVASSMPSTFAPTPA